MSEEKKDHTPHRKAGVYVLPLPTPPKPELVKQAEPEDKKKGKVK